MLLIKKCENCGQQFTKILVNDNAKQPKYCSKRCRVEGARKTRAQRKALPAARK